MPELALHFAVPFALTAPALGVRKAVLVSLISLIPDLDALFHVHRSASHSVVPLLAVSLVAVGLARRFRPGFSGLAYAGSLALLCHPVVDLFSTFTPILYPLLMESVYVNIQGSALIGYSIRPSFTAEISTKRTDFARFQSFDAPIFTNEGFIVCLLLVATPLLMAGLRVVPPLSKARKLDEN